MAVYLSPGVFPREIDLSVLPTAIGPLRPGFIGTAKKGPLNEPVLVTNATQAIETFGEPFSESYLMYAVLAFMEQGNAAFVMRVGVECEVGQPSELSDVCIDTSGGRGSGWGRIPLFTGIDFGRINLRAIGDGTGENPQPVTFHAESTSSVIYNDVELSSTDGPTTATGTLTGTYDGDLDDSWVMIITTPPNLSEDSPLVGAEYQVVRNSDGAIVAEGVLADSNFDNTSDPISIGTGLTLTVTVSAGELDENDTFTWSAEPDNRDFSVAVDGVAGSSYTMPSATYTSVADFVVAANALLSGEDYVFIAYTLDDGETVVPQIRTDIAGERVQVLTTQAWALELGSQQYAWDVPRSYLLGLDPGPYDITTSNNRVRLNLVGEVETTSVEFNVPVGLGQTTNSIASIVDAAGVVAGETLWNGVELTVPGGDTHVLIEASVGRQLDELQLLANYSNLRTLRFAEELNIPYPYQKAYRGYADNRVILPASGETDPSTPLSCETDPLSADCAADTAYFAGVVGWLVAPSAGTWVKGYQVNLSIFTAGVGDAAGRYTLTISDSTGAVLDSISDITFDKREARYIGNVVNPGTSLGGTNGNAYVNWEERPAFLNNNQNLPSFEVRLPASLNGKEFAGQANGIPLDPTYSSELDSAIIGNPAEASGLYAFQNPESIDINLLATPGFSSGAVIGTALQVSESRGDVLYLIDPPFGLRPQQVVDWHNGMLLSDLSAAINSSYGALYWGWLKSFDQFSNDEIWIPPSGHVSAVFSRTAREAEQWFAPAGLRRGRLLTALDVEYSPTQAERDLLYGSGNAVNPIVKFPQDGIVVWGQRTMQRTDSALDRVNVRMLLIFVKKNMTELLRQYIFEPNDRVLWKQVSATLIPFLADIQSRRGLNGFKVVVDETNNTPERIDRNELWVSVFLQPTKTVEFVVLNLVVLRSGASFSAEEVLAAGGVVTT
ncbi:phage tail sheath subtilisin-like domain-containing protein [bacterium]|nr:phage tail sheath subtilisin-like domain-containing protein [bacterium]